MIEYLKSLMTDRRFGASERGASAVEYGLLVAGIAALIVVAVFALGPIVKGAFEKTSTEMQKTPGAPAAPANPGIINNSMRIIG